MQWLAEMCVRRPVTATVIVLMLTVVGAFSYTRLGVDRFPKVDFPVVVVTVQEDGASPEEIESDVVDKIEESVNTISGIDSLQSTSYEGLGQVAITFVLEKDIDVAAQEVRDKVNQVLPDLPTDIKAPVVDKVDPDATPIMQIALSAPGNIRDTTEYADKVLRRQLENIPGVGQVTIVGGRKRQVNIWVDPNRMQAVGVTVADVQRALQAENIQIPGGQVDQNTRKLTLRTHGRVQTPAEFGDVVIAKHGDTVLHLSDVARVEDGMEEEQTVADLNGVPTVLLSIRKQSGLNTVATVDSIYEKLNTIKKTLPSDYKLIITQDQSTYIRAATDAVKEHLVVGSVLAALVVLLFLMNLRTTIISGIAIPASIISTFALMNAMNFTLNGLTLLALTLSVGIVIDDAIVVLENIYRFIEEKGMRPFEAAIEGTREIGMAVLATTMSLIAVFLPVAFMTGIVGRFMNSFGLTMAFAIFISLIVSFTLTPMLSSRWIKPPARPAGGPETPDGMPVGVGAEGKHGGKSKDGGLFKVIDTVYSWLLKFSLRHRWIIVLACFLSLYSMKWTMGAVPKNFLPDDDESQFQITVRTAEGTSLQSTKQLGDTIAQDVRDHLPGVDYTVLTIGDNDQKTENFATIFVKLKDVSKRPGLSQQDLTQRVRQEILPRYGSLRTSAGPIAAFSSGAPNAVITYSIEGPDLTKLTDYAEQALAELKKVPGVVDADTSLVVGQPELAVHIDRARAAELGASVSDIANALHLVVGGAKITEYYENGEQYEVHVRADKSYRDNPDVISQITVPTSGGSSVPLNQLVHFELSTGPSQIGRMDRSRVALVECNLKPGYSQQAIASKLESIINNLHMPPGYKAGASGTSKELVKATMAFLAAFVLAIVFMYLILAAQFESWVHPITILLALPLTFPFAILAILLFHQSLNIFSMLGILVLFGVVKKNGILQVDHTNQLRARGMDRYDAIVTANRDRLRPILMTTVAFVAGMFPLIVSNGTGAATNRNIGYTVIGGQTLSLLLTLLATPVFYSLFDDLTQFNARVRARIGNIRFRKRR